MLEFIRDADARRRPTLTMATAQFMRMMRDIKVMTGGFQDALVVEFLNGVEGGTLTPDQLRKMRTRYASRAAAWRPPRYLTRPASRIVLAG